MNLLKPFSAIMAITLTLGLAVSAIAMDPDEAVKARQAVLKDMGQTMKELGRISKGDINAERTALIAAAQAMRDMAPKPWAYFGQETSVARVKHEAKPAIWADPASFRSMQEKFIAAADDLALNAAKGDPKMLAEKIAALGGTCGACHKAFKE